MRSNHNARSSVKPSRNIAARAGRWSARHRKTAIIGWIAFVVLAFWAGGKVGTQTLTQEQSGVGDSGRAAKIVDGAYPDRVHEAVLIQSKSLKTDDPAYRATVADTIHRLEQTKGVTAIKSPYAHGGTISPDDHSALLSFEIPGDAEAATVDRTIDATVA